MSNPQGPQMVELVCGNQDQANSVQDNTSLVSPDKSKYAPSPSAADPLSQAPKSARLVPEDTGIWTPNGDILKTHSDPWYAQTILSLDGGGVKGYVCLLILDALMKEIELVEKTDPECHSSASPLVHRDRRRGSDTPRFVPAHYFDFVAGTSSGGILALMLGRLRMSPTECLESYGDLAERVFGRPRFIHALRFPFINPRCKFNHVPLEEAIKDITAKFDHSRNPDASFRQPCEKVCRTIVVSLKKTTTSGQVYLFRSYTHPIHRGRTFHEVNAGDINEQYIWQVGRATSAAPFYFKAIKLKQNGQSFKFYDGGLGANNPTSQAYNTVRLFFNQAKDVIGPVVSIGTGIVEGRKNRIPLWGKRRDEIDMIVQAAANSDVIHTNMANELPDNHYHRFNVDRDLGQMNLDSWKGRKGEETKRIMHGATNKYLERPDVRKYISQLAKELVAIRRARAHSDDPSRWEEFCHGVSYKCEFADCHEGRPAFAAAADFRSHLRMTHPVLAKDQEAYNREFLAGKLYTLYPEATSS